jgi:polyphosphate kinase
MLETVREFVPPPSREEKTESFFDSPTDINPFFNRELSWLEFNRRVLNEALDEKNPLLERLKFLAIFSTNLDEFFMIRVSGLKEQIAEGVKKRSRDGLSPAEQLREIRERLRPMLAEQMRCLNDDLLPELSERGIKICSYQDLNKTEKRRLDDYFLKKVFPVLTPQAVDVSHRFPFISNLSLNLGLIVEPEDDFQHDKLGHLFTTRRFSRIKLPPNVSRLIPIDDGASRFTLLGELISANVGYLFPRMKTGEPYLFRVTRDADVEIREDEAGDILNNLEEELHLQKRFSFPVRMEISASMPQEMIDYLSGSIGLTEHDVYRVEGFLNVPDLMRFYALDRPELKDKPIAYSIPSALRRRENIFEVIKQRDVLLHHPYTNYSAVTDFINAAAEDDDVLAIKICLYRTGKNSPIIESLVKASRNGKQVAALVELKARFDEENNIEWARYLEAEGVHVVYGMKGMKTHSKVTLVVRSEADELRRYVHIATGNYNPTTSRIYTDLGLLTADAQIGADATDLFNFLTGYSYQNAYRCLLVAPTNLRERMLEMIEREIEHQRNGREAHIIVKINSLTDDKIIRQLYGASQAGVKIDLIVRGICTLRPGIEGLSENIRVVSVVGRFLEHSRIFYFANGGAEEIFIGSADWMHRNLDRRVEAIVPIKDETLRKYLREEILAPYLRDNANASLLKPDGTYEKIEVGEDEAGFDAQMHFVGQET